MSQKGERNVRQAKLKNDVFVYFSDQASNFIQALKMYRQIKIK